MMDQTESDDYESLCSIMEELTVTKKIIQDRTSTKWNVQDQTYMHKSTQDHIRP